MISLPGFLGFLLPLPALSADRGNDPGPRRRRALEALRLNPHLLRDIGMEDEQEALSDRRWQKRIDGER